MADDSGLRTGEWDDPPSAGSPAKLSDVSHLMLRAPGGHLVDVTGMRPADQLTLEEFEWVGDIDPDDVACLHVRYAAWREPAIEIARTCIDRVLR